MWHYRYYGNDSGYAAAARNYTTLDRGLTPAEMDMFYVGLLGMQRLQSPTPAQLRAHLDRGPVVFVVVSPTIRHAMVAAGFNSAAGHYEVVDPAQGNPQITFTGQGSATTFNATGRLMFRRAREMDPRLDKFIWFW